MEYLDKAVTGAGGIALRYGIFYGDPDDELVEAVRARKFPVVGNGGGVWSFIHLDDAATATVLALEHDGPAIYNIVDDEPSPTREWLPEVARILGAKPPRHFPRLLGAALRGRGAGGDGDRVAGRVQREGQARARLDAALPELASGLRRPVREAGRRSLCAAVGSGRCRTGRVALKLISTRPLRR